MRLATDRIVGKNDKGQFVNVRGEIVIGTKCVPCRGKCLVPLWVVYAGGTNYANAPERARLAIIRAHDWYSDVSRTVRA